MTVDAPETEASPQAPEERPVGLGVVGWLRWGWRQLTSMRTALGDGPCVSNSCCSHNHAPAAAPITRSKKPPSSGPRRTRPRAREQLPRASVIAAALPRLGREVSFKL